MATLDKNGKINEHEHGVGQKQKGFMAKKELNMAHVSTVIDEDTPTCFFDMLGKRIREQMKQ